MPSPSPKVFTATVTHTGHTFKVQADQTLLQAAELAGSGSAGFLIDSSCRNGTCRTCICQLVEGNVTYQIEWPGLSVEEKREGFILPCAAYPVSDVVIRLPV
jgi:ferredoxin